MSRVVRYWRSRRGLMLGLVLLAVMLRAQAPEPPARSLEALASALRQASGAAVESDAVRWQPSAGLLADAIWGRSLVFLGRPEGHAGNDVWQARVRLTPEGQPIAVESPANWTRTPLGDERGLDVHGAYVGYVAVHDERLQGASLIRHEPHPLRLGVAAVSAMVSSRASSVHPATHVHFPPVEQLSLFIDDMAYRIELPLAAKRLAIPLDTSSAADGGAWRFEANDAWVEVWTTPRFGSARASASRWLRDGWSWLINATNPVRFRGRTLLARASEASAASNRSHSSEVTGHWPPRDLEPQLPALRGEGVWVAPSGGTPSAALYETFIRTDPAHPARRVQLVTMDLTQLELAMEAGWFAPHSRTGLPGRGRLPPQSAVRERVAAVFNGASAQPELGMQVRGRLLVPPRLGAPSVVVRDDTRVAIGSWPGSDGTALEPHPTWASFRQAPVALLAEGRALSPAASAQVGPSERSALCLGRGVLVYAWGRELSRAALQRALEVAGCRDAVQLDQGFGHGAFLVTHPGSGGMTAQPLVAGRRTTARVYGTGVERDFFYLLRRQPDRKLSAAKWGGLQWLPSPGPQPRPSEVPAVYAAEHRQGALRVALLALEPKRVRYDVSAGLGEPVIAGRAAPRRQRSERGDVLLTVELGHTTRAIRSGLWIDRRRAIPLRSKLASLWIDERGRLSVARPGEAVPPRVQSVVQLPLLLNGGELTERARSQGARRARGALCVSGGGRVWLASSVHDSGGPLALVLRELGCQWVVALDRGSKHALRLARHALPQLEGEASRLYAVARASDVSSFALSDPER